MPAEGRQAAAAGPSREGMMGARTGYQTPSKRPLSRELALQRHLGAGGELPLEGDPRPQKSQVHQPLALRLQLFYFQHISDPVTLSRREVGRKKVSLHLHPSLRLSLN